MISLFLKSRRVSLVVGSSIISFTVLVTDEKQALTWKTSHLFICPFHIELYVQDGEHRKHC